MNSIRVANQTNKTDRFQVSFNGLYLLNMYIIILTGSYGKIFTTRLDLRSLIGQNGRVPTDKTFLIRICYKVWTADTRRKT